MGVPEVRDFMSVRDWESLLPISWSWIWMGGGGKFTLLIIIHLTAECIWSHVCIVPPEYRYTSCISTHKDISSWSYKHFHCILQACLNYIFPIFLCITPHQTSTTSNTLFLTQPVGINPRYKERMKWSFPGCSEWRAGQCWLSQPARNDHPASLNSGENRGPT